MTLLAIDLFCGLGGWAEGFLAEGYDVIGFDIERHDYGTGVYPGWLVIQDVLTLHGSQLKDAAVIVGSSPCQDFSYRAMPWKRAKALGPPLKGIELFQAQFRIQREACEAAGRYIPLVVENVKGAQPWVGRAKWHYGSFYLWGDVPALMPIVSGRMKYPSSAAPRQWKDRDIQRLNDGVKAGDRCKDRNTGQWTTGWNVKNAQEWRKNSGGSWFNVAHNTESGRANNPVSIPAGLKTCGLLQQRDGHDHTRHLTNQAEHFGRKQEGSGPIWFDTGIAKHSSKSDSRKAASAQIAKIPFPLARHIARCFKHSLREEVLTP